METALQVGTRGSTALALVAETWTKTSVRGAEMVGAGGSTESCTDELRSVLAPDFPAIMGTGEWDRRREI